MMRTGLGLRLPMDNSEFKKELSSSGHNRTKMKMSEDSQEQEFS